MFGAGSAEQIYVVPCTVGDTTLDTIGTLLQLGISGVVPHYPMIEAVDTDKVVVVYGNTNCWAAYITIAGTVATKQDEEQVTGYSPGNSAYAIKLNSSTVAVIWQEGTGDDSPCTKMKKLDLATGIVSSGSETIVLSAAAYGYGVGTGANTGIYFTNNDELGFLPVKLDEGILYPNNYKYIGMVTSDFTNGSTVEVMRQGVLNGLTNTTIKEYFVDNIRSMIRENDLSKPYLVGYDVDSNSRRIHLITR
jgi:hypothetical protein